jgi:predicted ferric reductase
VAQPGAGRTDIRLLARSIAVMLAARPVQIERLLGSLDKFYRLHKWLGLAAAIVAVGHWLLETGPRWMVGQGWLTTRKAPI